MAQNNYDKSKFHQLEDWWPTANEYRNGAGAPGHAYWQQKVDYKMEVSMDVKTYLYKGKQELVYTNNSNDTLKKVYYHLFNNAFQPGSEMDMRLQNIKDPDARMVTKVKVGDKEVKESRIKSLKPNEIGFLHVSNFKQDGVVAAAKEVAIRPPIIIHINIFIFTFL